jgi:MFS family permease
MSDSRQNRYLLLAILTLISAFNWTDRIALGVVQEGIKRSLLLSDTELGLLGGIAFALFYSIMGIPIARWADKGNRALIITLTTASWSALVALSAVVRNFGQLLLIRVGIGVGEAGCVPPAHSLLADRFSRVERPRAMSVYMQAAPVAMVIGYAVSGWIDQTLGWRDTFLVIGLPGLILALVAALTVKEPRRQAGASSTNVEVEGEQRPTESLPVRDTLRRLWAIRSFRHLLMCFAIWYLFGYGLLQWQPTFYVRSHGLTSGQVGMWFGLVYGLVGGLGVFLGGELATRYAANNERLQLMACALAFIIYGGLTAGSLLTNNIHVSFALLSLAILGGNISQGPILATLQTLVPPNMRAFSIALVYFVANLVGLGFGPLAVGGLSDVLHARVGQESLRWALVALCPGYIWAAAHLWLAGARIDTDQQAST